MVSISHQLSETAMTSRSSSPGGRTAQAALSLLCRGHINTCTRLYRARAAPRTQGEPWVQTWWITAQLRLINTPLTRSTTATWSVYLNRCAGDYRSQGCARTPGGLDAHCGPARDGAGSGVSTLCGRIFLHLGLISTQMWISSIEALNCRSSVIKWIWDD